jgi:hypothetical protein
MSPGDMSDPDRPNFFYFAFGLQICSEIELSHFMPVGVRRPDVHIRLGKVPDSLEHPHARGVLYQSSPQEFLLNIDGIARYLISGGDEILIQPAAGADKRSVNLFLFGSALGALFHQRGLLPLHASGIVVEQGAVLFAGASGCGKSTIAAAFHQRGYPVLADDICPIQITNPIRAMPGTPFLMLWKDALLEIAHISGLTRVRPELEKYIFPLGTRFAGAGARLHTVYIIEATNADLSPPTPIKGIEKIDTLTRHTYRPRFVEHMRREDDYLRQVVAVAESTRLRQIDRPGGGFRLNELVDLIEADIKD